MWPCGVAQDGKTLGDLLNVRVEGDRAMAFKTNRENAEIAQAAATSATLENVRIREQRSADAYAALATRDERIAAKAAALQPADRNNGEVTSE